MKTPWRLPLTAFVFAITNRATTLHSQNETDKISNRNSVRMFAWYLACFARKQRSPKWERRCGRDALSNTSCESVVAKTNEADCSANAEVQTREERGNCNLVVIWWEKIPEWKEGVNIILKYATYTLAENEKTPALKPSKILSERFICAEQSCFLFLFSS